MISGHQGGQYLVPVTFSPTDSESTRCVLCGSEQLERAHIQAKLDVVFLADHPPKTRAAKPLTALVCIDCGFVHIFRAQVVASSDQS